MQQQSPVSSSSSSSQISSYYNLQNRLIVQQSGLYKLQKYDNDHLMFTAPDAKCVAVVHKATLDSETIRKIQCHDKPSSLDLINVAGRNIVVIGGQRGTINIKIIAQSKVSNSNNDDNEESNVQKIHTQHQWIFQPESPDEVYANDIVHWPPNPNILVNCFNNGSVAIWGLLNQKRLHTFKRVHQKYLYKLRFQTESILVSCGYDATVMRTDLQKQTQISMFSHVLPAWGIYPIDSNQIASVGLFGRVLVWDVRSNSIVQACNNNSGQSSFITGKQHQDRNLYYGDSNMLLRWDRRKHQPEQISRSTMLVSAQALLFDQDCLYACGRGKDLIKLKGSHTMQDSAHVFEYLRTQLVLLRQNQHHHQQNEQASLQDADDQQWQTQSQNQSEQDSSMVEEEKEPLIKSNNKQRKQAITIISALKLKLDNIRKYAEYQEKLQTKLSEQDEMSNQGQQFSSFNQNIMVSQQKQKQTEQVQKVQTKINIKHIQTYVKSKDHLSTNSTSNKQKQDGDRNINNNNNNKDNNDQNLE